MPQLAQSTYQEIEHLAAALTEGLRMAGSLEDAAQWFTARLAEQFSSIVLARVFATVEFSRLPLEESRFAARSTGGVSLFSSTDVLTLMGTSGTQPAWNDRRASRSHLATPLLNRTHVEEIPMVSRLLSDLRFRLMTDREADVAPFVTRAFANANGLFYVADARTTVDDHGRNIVPSSEFVNENGIRTVFGFGGSYVTNATFVSTILFTRESIDKDVAMRFIQLSSAFKAGTTRFISRGRLFAGGHAASNNG